MNLDEKWTSFERGRRIIVSVDVSDREAHEVATGPKDPQTACAFCHLYRGNSGGLKAKSGAAEKYPFVDDAACRMRQFK